MVNVELDLGKRLPGPTTVNSAATIKNAPRGCSPSRRVSQGLLPCEGGFRLANLQDHAHAFGVALHQTGPFGGKDWFNPRTEP